MSGPDIQLADAKSRRKLIWLLSVLTLTAIALAIYLEQCAQTLDERLASVLLQYAEQPWFALAVGLFVAAPCLAAAVVLFRFGSAAYRFERLPPPGYAVIRDTEVIQGARARNRGRLAQVIAFALGVLGICAGVPMVGLLQALAA